MNRSISSSSNVVVGGRRKSWAHRKIFHAVMTGALFGALATGCSVSSTSTSGMSGKAPNQTIIIQQSGIQRIQEKKTAESREAIKDFAIVNYAKISADNENGGGDFMASLIVLMENDGISRENAHDLIKQALASAGGRADMFGEYLVTLIMG